MVWLVVPPISLTLVVGAAVGASVVAVGALVVGAAVDNDVGACVGAVGALVVGAVVGGSGPEHVTPFCGAHAPVLRHAGHSAPSVKDISQVLMFPTMLQMPDSVPVNRLPNKCLRSAA